MIGKFLKNVKKRFEKDSGIVHINSVEILEQMKKDGFKFDREICPIKLSEPKEIHPNDDGTVTYTQWFLTDDGTLI